jgi:raffinose/stachyose/melibiose transport system substrate-binding protein
MKLKSVLSMVLALLMVLSFAACGAADKTAAPASTETAVAASTPAEPAAASTVAEPAAKGVPAIDAIKLGEDYKDLKASLKFLTHRTDLVDTKLAGYITEFKKLYPNIDIKYEGITDYAQDVTVRLTTDQWGDICMIPTTVDKAELPNLFVPYGDKAKLDTVYNNFLNNFSYKGTVYGIPSTANAQGIVYNKKVFKDAGITTVPKTPDEFLAALQAIKDKTKAIPLYTNFAAGWTMGAWDYYISGSATGDADYMNNKLLHGKDPFADRGDGTGPYAVYNLLYEAVARGLVEKDPTTTDWEGCKPMMNKGEIGTLALGSWAVSQMQQAGDKPDDVGYMPFPITVGGKQFATAGPDYCYGINAKASDENKIASMLYIKYLAEQSKFAYSEGGIPLLKTEEYPALYKDFAGIELVVDNPALEGEESLFNQMNEKSEVGITKENTHVQMIVESALSKAKKMSDIAAEWNAKWAKAQADLKVEIK